jgi:hypothetical protein
MAGFTDMEHLALPLIKYRLLRYFNGCSTPGMKLSEWDGKSSVIEDSSREFSWTAEQMIKSCISNSRKSIVYS